MTRTRPRPLIRRNTDGYWRIYVGHSRYCLPDYYTNRITAMSAAANIRPQRRATT